MFYVLNVNENKISDMFKIIEFVLSNKGFFLYFYFEKWYALKAFLSVLN